MRKYYSNGSVSILFLPFSVAFFFISVLVWDIGLWLFTSERVQTAADAVLLSSLRVRAEGLQKISVRWAEFGQYFLEGFPNKEVYVPSVHWAVVQSKAESLRRAIPGYKGRIVSVITVTAEANGYDSDAGILEISDAQKLGVAAESLLIKNEGGKKQSVAGGWYRREWSPHEMAPQPPEESILKVTLRSPMVGQSLAASAVALWRGRQSATAHLKWDVDPGNPEVQFHGNGGYPRDWNQVIEGSRVNPHRYPLYEGRLKTLDEIQTP